MRDSRSERTSGRVRREGGRAQTFSFSEGGGSEGLERGKTREKESGTFAELEEAGDRGSDCRKRDRASLSASSSADR